MTAPPLPKREQGWHEMTRAWWTDVWESPMAAEFVKSDVHGLYILAERVDQFWTEPSNALAAEIRLQRQCFGLTPIDRRRLQWEVERVEQARQRKPVARPAEKGAADPRRLLSVVK